MDKRLGGDIAGTANPSWPKGCFTQCDVIFMNTNWARRRRRRSHFGFQVGYCLETD